MDRLHKLYKDFREWWPLETVRHTSLQEYSMAKRKSDGELDTFTYWIEAKMQELRSI